MRCPNEMKRRHTRLPSRATKKPQRETAHNAHPRDSGVAVGPSLDPGSGACCVADLVLAFKLRASLGQREHLDKSKA
jgi:hypothetical protein